MIFSDSFFILILIFMRITGIFLQIPLFSSRNIPSVVKVWFVFFITIVITPTIIPGTLDFSNFMTLGYYMLIEFITGLLLGGVVLFVLNALYIAGNIIDTNIGFSMVNVISPTDENQLPVTANLYYVIFMITFLITNSHHAIIRAVVRSFEIIPLGQSFLSGEIINELIKVLGESFVLGVKISMPIILTIIIANVILGILSKAMPGMNVFVIGMPFKILIGLSIILIASPYLFTIFVNMLDSLIDEFNRLIILYK